MRILVSAYACEPGKGSEPGVGWNFVKEMSRRHSLTVLTRSNNRVAIESSGEEWIWNVHWIWYDPSPLLTLWKRRGHGVQLFYILWQIGLARYVRKNLNAKDFDLVHHITFGRYWVPSFLGSFGPPLVFGPVGGGDETPAVFHRIYSYRGRLAEIKKRIAEHILTMLFYRIFRQIALGIAATDQTAEKLQKLVSCPVVVHPQSAISEKDVATMHHATDVSSRETSPRFTTACRLEHWKAVDLAIRAFPAVLNKYPSATLEILGNGPEKERLKKIVDSLSLEKNISFLGQLPTQEDVWHQIAFSTALVHPALHESFGQVCLEAIAIGTPLVCWNWAGPGIIANRCGIPAVKLPDNPKDLSGFSNAMISFCKNRSTPVLSQSFLWSQWCDAMDVLYKTFCL